MSGGGSVPGSKMRIINYCSTLCFYAEHPLYIYTTLWVQLLFVLSDSNREHQNSIACTHICANSIFLHMSTHLIYPHMHPLLNSGQTNCFQRVLSLFTIGLSAMMCCLGVFGIIEHSEIAEIFVSVYMILFAVLLFFYELMWWKAIPAVNKNLRMNFGFLYGVTGKALYLIFVAFLVIGLKDDVSVKFLRWMTGGCFLGTGILMLFCHFTKPELLSSYKAPTAGLGEDVNMPV